MLPVIYTSQGMASDLTLRAWREQKVRVRATEDVLGSPPQPGVEHQVQHGGHHGVTEGYME